ncbi:tether containing UBX domain for GLUT4 [Cylas formicarius]|uniref:tether containing UBX domain for GLUT4 n=1 Tax=Cylas formicarius TaxID=197179 RepID=UPI002958350C|nr:tether containing UBX domain for GLUT4 [Cylas formicarius]
MSGLSVVVLAPNGRRQTVKCNPNTTILQIIEEVCRKQGYKPEEYDIKHHNKILDTTQTFRFSGLPNNAQLELAAALKNRIECDITLAVNLEDGRRITDTFKPRETLQVVLQKTCPELAVPEKNPVVIYTRREIYGDELGKCTLRSLGLTGGRAMIRVINRDPELLKQQANVSACLPSKPPEERPYVRKYQPLDDDNRSSSQKAGPESCNTAKVDPIQIAKEKRKSNEEHCADQQLEKKKVTDYKPVRIAEPMDVDPDETQESQVVSLKSIDEEFIFCGDRNGMIFSLESAISVPAEDLPEDFFELTIDDAKKILRDVKRRRNELENQELRTSQLRKLEQSKKELRQLNRYKKAVIRVELPDRTVIQGTFKPTETIRDVLDFVRGYLRDPDIDFYIYATPPKCILNVESRLIEVGCVPGALLHFGSKDDIKEGLLKKEFENMFTTNSVASLAAARIRQENTRTGKSTYVDDDPMDGEEVDVNQGASTSVCYDDSLDTGRKIVRSTENVPKWFKPLQ